MRTFVGALLLTISAVAEAYVGPGLGVGVIGAIIGLLTAILLAVVGTVWYPVKRMLRARSAQQDERLAQSATDETLAEGEPKTRQ